LRIPGQRKIVTEDGGELRGIFYDHRPLHRPGRGEADKRGDIHARQSLRQLRRLRYETNAREAAR
jgi:hypothetical protein